MGDNGLAKISSSSPSISRKRQSKQQLKQPQRIQQVSPISNRHTHHPPRPLSRSSPSIIHKKIQPPPTTCRKILYQGITDSPSLSNTYNNRKERLINNHNMINTSSITMIMTAKKKVEIDNNSRRGNKDNDDGPRPHPRILFDNGTTATSISISRKITSSLPSTPIPSPSISLSISSPVPQRMLPSSPPGPLSPSSSGDDLYQLSLRIKERKDADKVKKAAAAVTTANTTNHMTLCDNNDKDDDYEDEGSERWESRKDPLQNRYKRKKEQQKQQGQEQEQEHEHHEKQKHYKKKRKVKIKKIILLLLPL